MLVSKSPIGWPFDEIVQTRAQREPAYADGLLQEAVQAMLAGDLDVARSPIRDVIQGSGIGVPRY
jgi:hypothetical protein